METPQCAVCIFWAGEGRINPAITMVCGTYVCYITEHIDRAINWHQNG